MSNICRLKTSLFLEFAYSVNDVSSLPFPWSKLLRWFSSFLFMSTGKDMNIGLLCWRRRDEEFPFWMESLKYSDNLMLFDLFIECATSFVFFQFEGIYWFSSFWKYLVWKLQGCNSIILTILEYLQSFFFVLHVTRISIT